MPTPKPTEPDTSRIIRGMSRRDVAKAMGMSVRTVEAIEQKFSTALLDALKADPETRHLIPRQHRKS